MPHERGEPAARHDRVVVQETEVAAARGGRGGVHGGREAAVLGKRDHPEGFAAPRGLAFEPLPRAVGRAVVGEQDLGRRPVRAAVEGLEAEPCLGQPVVRHDGDRDEGVEIPEPAVERPRAVVPRVLARERPARLRGSRPFRRRLRESALEAGGIGGQAHEPAGGVPLERAQPGRDHGAPGRGGLVELDGIDGVRQLGRAERDDLRVESGAQLRKLAVRPLAVEDDVAGHVEGSAPRVRPAHDLEAPVGAPARELREERFVEPRVHRADVADREGALAPRPRGSGEKRVVAGVREEARRRAEALAEGFGSRDDEVRLGGETALVGQDRLRPVRRETGVDVETVVDDFPAEPFAQREGERRPERALDEKGRFVELVLLARAGQRVDRVREALARKTPLARILARHAGDREERDARGDADGLPRGSRPSQHAVEDALAAPRERLRELLWALAAVRPGDDGKEHDVGAARPGLVRIELVAREVHRGLADSEQALGRESAPHRAAEAQGEQAAAEDVEASPQTLLPLRPHADFRKRRRRSSSRSEIRRPAASTE